MYPLNELKSIQKKLATTIKEHHDDWDSITFRHQHIAYCELRGRTRSQIEVPGKDNLPDEKWISRIKSEWEPKIEEWKDEWRKAHA
jgi:hypothetical protein